jgi:hypothetical protein
MLVRELPRMKQITYSRHRFPGSIIQHALWLYFRFPLPDQCEKIPEQGLFEDDAKQVTRAEALVDCAPIKCEFGMIFRKKL